MNFKNIIKKSFLFSLIGCSISTFGLIPKNDILSQGFGLNLLTKFTAKAEFKSGKNKLQNAVILDPESAIITFQEDNDIKKAEDISLIWKDGITYEKNIKIAVTKVLSSIIIEADKREFGIALVTIKRTEDVHIPLVINYEPGFIEKQKKILLGTMQDEQTYYAGSAEVNLQIDQIHKNLFTTIHSEPITFNDVRLETKDEANSHLATLAIALIPGNNTNNFVLCGLGLTGLNEKTGKSLFIRTSALKDFLSYAKCWNESKKDLEILNNQLKNSKIETNQK